MTKADQIYMLLTSFKLAYSDALTFINCNKKLFKTTVNNNFHTHEKTFIFEDESKIVFDSNDITYRIF